jgi:hypothetical protein
MLIDRNGAGVTKVSSTKIENINASNPELASVMLSATVHGAARNKAALVWYRVDANGRAKGTASGVMALASINTTGPEPGLTMLTTPQDLETFIPGFDATHKHQFPIDDERFGLISWSVNGNTTPSFKPVSSENDRVTSPSSGSVMVRSRLIRPNPAPKYGR